MSRDCSFKLTMQSGWPSMPASVIIKNELQSWESLQYMISCAQMSSVTCAQSTFCLQTKTSVCFLSNWASCGYMLKCIGQPSHLRSPYPNILYLSERTLSVPITLDNLNKCTGSPCKTFGMIKSRRYTKNSKIYVSSNTLCFKIFKGYFAVQRNSHYFAACATQAGSTEYAPASPRFFLAFQWISEVASAVFFY